MKSKIVLAFLVATVLTACGGGGGSGGACNGSAEVCSPTDPVQAPAIIPSYKLAQHCAAPRPADAKDAEGRLYGDVQESLDWEKEWIRSYVNETYLWYNEVFYVDPSPYVVGGSVTYMEPSSNLSFMVPLESNYAVVDAYFNSQRTVARSASGKPKDRFHFTYPTATWEALSNSGNVGGFGFEVALLSASPPRKALVAYTSPDTPAAQANLKRGAEFVSVNGVDVSGGSDVDTLNEGLFSPVPGKSYTFEVRDQGATASRTVTMTAATITLAPVQNAGVLPAPYGNVGYIQFNDHIATAEAALVAAVNQLKAANGGKGISDLVLDMRYNGGGYLAIASELAYMIAGADATKGKVFEQLSFNDKNPFDLKPDQTITPFIDVTLGYSTLAGQPLPQLGLPRVFVLTGSGTCSASEAVINGLRGAGISVIQIGATTCGKPYGFLPQDNCSTTYFTVQFKGINNAGYGDYTDGFAPGGGTGPADLPGCLVDDDFTKQLGDPAEGRLAAALQYRASGTCPPLASASGKAARLPWQAPSEPPLMRSPLRENRFLRRSGYMH